MNFNSGKPLGGNNPFNPKASSVPFDGGGDTHIHPHKNNPPNLTVTTRLPGGITIHNHFNGNCDQTGSDTSTGG